MGVDIAWPDLFSLVYATPLLQHQAQLGLNPAPNFCRETVRVKLSPEYARWKFVVCMGNGFNSTYTTIAYSNSYPEKIIIGT